MADVTGAERHVPVMLDRIVGAAGPGALEPGPAEPADACWSTAPSGWAGTPRRCCDACPQAAADRPRPRSAGAGGRPASGWRRTRDRVTPGGGRLRRAARGAGRARASPRSRACCSTSGSRRCRSTTGAAASRTPSTRRWTCGWTASRSCTAAEVAQHLLRGRAGRDPAAVRRGTVRRPDRPADRAPSASGAPFETSARLVASCSTRHPGGRPGLRRAPGQADVPGAADRGERANSTPWRRSLPEAVAALSRRRPDRRAGLPLAGGPAGQAGAGGRGRGQRTARSAGGAGRVEPQLRLLTRGAERPTEDEIAANRRAASARLRAAERIRPTASDPHRPRSTGLDRKGVA